MKCFWNRIINPEHICEHCLVKGDVVHYVHALATASFMTSYRIAYRPKQIRTRFVAADYDFDGRTIRTTFSLLDANVIPNNYNYHKLFRFKLLADIYLWYCKKYRIRRF